MHVCNQVALAFVPGAVVVFVVRERESHRNSKHQQIVSGANIFAYWLANYAFDTTMWTVTATGCMLMFKVRRFSSSASSASSSRRNTKQLLWV